MNHPFNLERNECYYLTYQLLIIRLELGDAAFQLQEGLPDLAAIKDSRRVGITKEADTILSN